jgi:hypothetical protein
MCVRLRGSHIAGWIVVVCISLSPRAKAKRVRQAGVGGRCRCHGCAVEMEGQGEGFLGDAKGTGGNALRVDALNAWDIRPDFDA